MGERQTSFLGRYGRLVWGGAAALLLLVLAASFVLSGSSISGAELEAQRRAEGLASSVVEEQLTPDLLIRDIDGADYRDLTVRVQAGILSDDRFEVVRIWRLDGGLIYSTAQRDDVNGVAAGDDQWIQQALGGRTVSVVSSAGTYHEGLRRPTEELFQTFIPVRLSGDAVDGVVQIDQRYGAIHDRAYRLWRPVQIATFLLLIGAGVMLVRTLRGAASYGEGGVERRQSPGRRANDLSVRDAVDRADHAEQRVRQTEKRVAELETQLARAPSTATATAAIEELDLRLRASEAEREELAGTVKRLQNELAESQAEVTLARQGSAGTPAETDRVNKLIADAQSKAVTAERKAAVAERKAQDAAKRASVSAERGLELEAQLRETEKLAGDMQKASGGVDQRVVDGAVSTAALEERANKAELELVDSEERFADAQGRLAEALDKLGELEQARAAMDEDEPAPGIGSGAGAEPEGRIAELESAHRTDVVELQRAHEAFANSQLELSNTTRKLRQAEARVKELERSGGRPTEAEPERTAEPAPSRDADQAPVSPYVAAADHPEPWGDVEDPFGDSSEPFANTRSDSPTPAAEPVEEEPAGGLSLRERLARAAAARKRLS